MRCLETKRRLQACLVRALGACGGTSSRGSDGCSPPIGRDESSQNIASADGPFAILECRSPAAAISPACSPMGIPREEPLPWIATGSAPIPAGAPPA